MKILITGANGFIGKHLVSQLLKENHDIYAIVTNKDDMKEMFCDRLHVFSLYFDQYNQISSLIKVEIDAAFHFAWRGLSGEESSDLTIQLENVKATEVLLKELKKLNIKSFFLASTMNRLEIQQYLSNPLNFTPRNVYNHVAAKIEAEIFARLFCYNNSIRINVGLIAMVYGEGNYSKMITNVFINSLLKNKSPQLIKGSGQYDIIYISDVVDAFISMLEKGINGKTYYIGHNWNKSFKEIFCEIKNIINPAINLKFGSINSDNKIDFSDINRVELTNDTGWKPHSNFKESIIRTAKWLEDNYE